MTGSGRRLPEGGWIDRDRPVAFTFNGKRYQGLAGDTLASALLSNGVTLIGRSFKYHRPRGIMGAGYEDSGSAVQLVGDEDAPLHDRDRARKDQPVAEDRRLVRLAVVIGILKHRDAPHRPVVALARDVGHEPAHLDDPEPAVLVEGNRDGILHHRLVGEELDPEAGGDREGLQRVGR